MILNDATLKENLHRLFDFEKSDTIIEEVCKQINPNSIDLTLDRFVTRMEKSKPLIYGAENKGCWESTYDTSNNLVLLPNECVLCCTKEYVIMPDDLCGQLFTKSTLGRMFVNHMMAGVIDAGFEGRITLEFKNDSPNVIYIPYGSRVVQLVYSELYEKAKEPYSQRKSRYNHAECCEAPKEEIYG